MIAPAAQERQRPPIPAECKAEIHRLSVTASAVCELVAGGEPWTFETLATAAQALETGSPSLGIRRPYRRLATSLRRIAVKWFARTREARL